MKPNVLLKRIHHRGHNRLAIVFNYNKEIIGILRSMSDAEWSSTKGCWYVDDGDENLQKLLSIFKDIAEVDISKISFTSVDKTEVSTPVNKLPENKIIHPTPNKPKDPPFRQTSNESIKGGWKKYGPVEFMIDEADDKLVIKFTGRYDPEWIREIKSFGNAWFDYKRKEWVLDWSRLAVDSLSDYFSSHDVEVSVRKNVVTAAIKGNREEKGMEIRDRELDGETMQGVENVRRYLSEKRYSARTIESYISLIILFFKYFIPRKPADLTEEDISDFFNDYVLFNKYSSSYQNQIISGLKIYFRLNGIGRIDSSVFGRPRKRRTLPKVFSKDEVQKILNSVRNNKHRLLLWMIYSCGLRRSEVTNIKMKDLDRQRGILNILEAKGKVDRFVPVSGKVWEKIDEYVRIYHPSYWLFEGQTGGKYSSESVYRVFKQALKNAGIRKEVGVHSLRHSYATHLHESGLDIRYIQELLGHKSTRTTEIYTHVSRRNLIAVRSPIEDMELI
jgi:integrase/recombinase XerD